MKPGFVMTVSRISTSVIAWVSMVEIRPSWIQTSTPQKNASPRCGEDGLRLGRDADGLIGAVHGQVCSAN